MADSCDGVILHLGGSGHAAVKVAKSIYHAKNNVVGVLPDRIKKALHI